MPYMMDSGAVIRTAIDWVALAGIAGTLIGVLIGAMTTYFIQRRQLDHADETRFHDRRMELYASLTRSANEYVIAHQLNGDAAEASTMWNESFNQVRLMASQDVADIASEIHRSIHEIINMPAVTAIGDDLMLRFNTAIAALIVGARKELKIETN